MLLYSLTVDVVSLLEEDDLYILPRNEVQRRTRKCAVNNILEYNSRKDTL